jgi:hypothetical protein
LEVSDRDIADKINAHWASLTIDEKEESARVADEIIDKHYQFTGDPDKNPTSKIVVAAFYAAIKAKKEKRTVNGV